MLGCLTVLRVEFGVQRMPEIFCVTRAWLKETLGAKTIGARGFRTQNLCDKRLNHFFLSFGKKDLVAGEQLWKPCDLPHTHSVANVYYRGSHPIL